MSYANRVGGAYGGGGYAGQTEHGYGASAPATGWAGRRKVLTTDQYGHVTAGQSASITDLVPGDSYELLLSGVFIPDATIITAILVVDSLAGVNQFGVAAVVLADGSGGTYSLGLHMAGANTAQLTASAYRYSVVITCGPDVFTPINGSYILPRRNLAV